jgi:3-oxoacyl-[acyl-carrier protein] reductase
MELEGKVVLVTGGGRGIGREICLQLARRGAAVAVNYSGSESAAESTRQLIESGGGRAITVRADVSDYAQCEALFAQVEKQLGAPDILINNAGVTRDNLIMRMTPEDFAGVIDVNLVGTFNCVKLATRAMIKRRYGRIVNIASVVGLIGNAGQANYAASKAGIIALTKSAAKELAGRGITSNAVAPGFIGTDMTAALSDTVRGQMLGGIPQKRLGAPSDVAAAVAFLCSDGAAYITGQVLAVDGGMTMGG